MTDHYDKPAPPAFTADAVQAVLKESKHLGTMGIRRTRNLAYKLLAALEQAQESEAEALAGAHAEQEVSREALRQRDDLRAELAALRKSEESMRLCAQSVLEERDKLQDANATLQSRIAVLEAGEVPKSRALLLERCEQAEARIMECEALRAENARLADELKGIGIAQFRRLESQNAAQVAQIKRLQDAAWQLCEHLRPGRERQHVEYTTEHFLSALQSALTEDSK